MLFAHVADALGRAVGHADAERCEAGAQPTLGAAPPADRPPRLLGQQLLGGHRLAVGDGMLARPAVTRDREDRHDIGGYTFCLPGMPTAQARPRC